MPKSTAAEWLLARLTTPDRAAAILGDLTEMATTRGRLWFWIAYVRTVVSLGWRTPVAVFAIVISEKYIRSRGLFMLLLRPFFIHNWYEAHRLAAQHPFLSHFCWAVSLQAVFTLWYVLPYVMVRFGLRNRLTYLAGALFLLSIPVLTLNPRVYEITGIACALLILAALASPLWRRQMIFLAANLPVTPLVFYFCVAHPVLGIFHHGPFPAGFLGMRIDDPFAIAITVMICPLLYRWLLQPRPTGGTHAELA
jgi:hypothetical protein